MTRTTEIQRLNDAFRTTFTGGRLNLTIGVSAMPGLEQADLLNQIAGFTAFTLDNDPHEEHDFGAVEQAGTRYFWKIDYYDLQLQMHSPDAADPAVTVRVLTVMRADEY